AQQLGDVEEVYGAVHVGVAGEGDLDEGLAGGDGDAGILSTLIRARRVSEGVLGRVGSGDGAGEARGGPILVRAVGVGEVRLDRRGVGVGEQGVVGQVEGGIAGDGEGGGGVGEARGGRKEGEGAVVGDGDGGLREATGGHLGEGRAAAEGDGAGAGDGAE